MKSNITKVEKVSKSYLPIGTHNGLWTAYEVVVGEEWRLRTEIGMRGINVPCLVTVTKNGDVTVET